MGDPKPLASLTSGLLARKGQAAPAMRRQSMMISAPEQVPTGHHNPLEDLGWNDMGDEQAPVRQATGLSPMANSTPAPSALTSMPLQSTPVDFEFDAPEPPPVVRQQEELARNLARPAFDPEPLDVSATEPFAPEPIAPELVVPEPFAEAEPLPVAMSVPQHAPVIGVRAPIEAAAIVQPSQAPTVRAAPGSKGKAAFTLRLDGGRHLQLRLVCAVKHRSAQQIVTQALDEFLAKQPSAEQLMAGGSVN